jgi:arsenate reductase
MTVTIYHNPDCSNSRGALAILREHGIEPVIVEYLRTPLRVAELAALADKLRETAGAAWLGLRDGMLRAKEAVWSELTLDGANDAALLAAVAAHPILLNRPIVITPKGARLCRPPELLHEIL